jgi:hypothetical protein
VLLFSIKLSRLILKQKRNDGKEERRLIMWKDKLIKEKEKEKERYKW